MLLSPVHCHQLFKLILGELPSCLTSFKFWSFLNQNHTKCCTKASVANIHTLQSAEGGMCCGSCQHDGPHKKWNSITDMTHPLQVHANSLASLALVKCLITRCLMTDFSSIPGSNAKPSGLQILVYSFCWRLQWRNTSPYFSAQYCIFRPQNKAVAITHAAFLY